MSNSIILPSNFQGLTRANIDPFGRIRISEARPLFEGTHVHGANPLLFVEKLIGGASSAYISGEAAVDLTCGTASGDKAIMQTRQYCYYMPGRAQSIRMTGIIGTQKTNVRQRKGYFDDDNGVFFEQTGTDRAFVVRKNGTDIRILQADWNIDTLDGSNDAGNLSGILFDPEKVQLLAIDFQWLGAGEILYGFNIDGVLIYCHQQFHTNRSSAGVYMATPELPARTEIENVGVTSGSTTTRCICTAIVTEGANDPIGLPFTVDTNINAITASNGILTPIIALRATSGSKVIWQPISFSAMSLSSDDFLLKIYLGDIDLVSGAWIPVSGSNLEYNITAASFTGGIPIYTNYISSQSRAREVVPEERQRPGLSVDGNPDIVVLAVVPRADISILASLNWQEF